MEIISLFDNKCNFKIYLLEDVKNYNELIKVCNLDYVCLLNPEYILGVNHISIAIEKSVTSKKRRLDRPISKEIVFYSCLSNKLDMCLDIHNASKIIDKVKNNTNKDNSEGNQTIDIKSNENNTLNVFLIYCNNTYFPKYNKEVEDLFECKCLEVEDFSKYTNLNYLIKEFNINDIEFNNEAGIIGSIYNRLSLKDY